MRGLVVALAAGTLVAVLGPVVVAEAAEATVTVDVSPGTPKVGDTVTVSGDVTDGSGQAVANATLTASRTDSAGDHPLMVDMANGSGHYSFDDVPTVHGDVTWIVTWQGPNGDVSGHRTVTVTRQPTTLTLAVSDTQVPTGTTVDLTAHLDSPTTDRTVGIYARPYGQPRELVKRDVVDASGDLRATYDVARGTTFIARFDGDAAYAPATDRKHVDVVARLANHLAGGYDTQHGYTLFHVGDDAHVKAHLRPELDGVCLYFRAQRRQAGDWRTTAVSPCVETGSGGRATGKLSSYTALVDKPYRVRAEWRGGPGALADNGRWLRLRFRG
jgi:hypothetical protein